MLSHRTGFTRKSCGLGAFRKSLTVAVGVGVLIAAIPCDSVAEKPIDETLARIFDAARAREAKVRSLKISWQESTLAHRDTELNKESPFRARNKKDNTPIEQGDVRHTERHTVSLAGESIRHTYQRDNRTEDISVFDGSTNRRLNYPPIPGLPQGALSKVAESVRFLTLKPLFWMVRILSTNLSNFSAEQFRVVDRHAVINGTECIQISDDLCDEVGKPVAAGSTSFWLDPARDYCIVRMAYGERRPGRADFEVDISYAEHPTAGWMLANWTTLSRRGGKVTFTSNAKVTSVAVNPEISPSEFQLTFPSRTMVIDSRGHDERVFLVREDGTERTVTFKERCARISIDDLLKSEPDELIPRK